jgi:hypothetical protein
MQARNIFNDQTNQGVRLANAYFSSNDDENIKNILGGLKSLNTFLVDRSNPFSTNHDANYAKMFDQYNSKIKFDEKFEKILNIFKEDYGKFIDCYLTYQTYIDTNCVFRETMILYHYIMIMKIIMTQNFVGLVPFSVPKIVNNQPVHKEYFYVDEESKIVNDDIKTENLVYNVYLTNMMEENKSYISYSTDQMLDILYPQLSVNIKDKFVVRKAKSLIKHHMTGMILGDPNDDENDPDFDDVNRNIHTMYNDTKKVEYVPAFVRPSTNTISDINYSVYNDLEFYYYVSKASLCFGNNQRISHDRKKLYYYVAKCYLNYFISLLNAILSRNLQEHQTCPCTLFERVNLKITDLIIDMFKYPHIFQIVEFSERKITKTGESKNCWVNNSNRLTKDRRIQSPFLTFVTNILQMLLKTYHSHKINSHIIMKYMTPTLQLLYSKEEIMKIYRFQGLSIICYNFPLIFAPEFIKKMVEFIIKMVSNPSSWYSDLRQIITLQAFNIVLNTILNFKEYYVHYIAKYANQDLPTILDGIIRGLLDPLLAYETLCIQLNSEGYDYISFNTTILDSFVNLQYRYNSSIIRISEIFNCPHKKNILSSKDPVTNNKLITYHNQFKSYILDKWMFTDNQILKDNLKPILSLSDTELKLYDEISDFHIIVKFTNDQNQTDDVIYHLNKVNMMKFSSLIQKNLVNETLFSKDTVDFHEYYNSIGKPLKQNVSGMILKLESNSRWAFENILIMFYYKIQLNLEFDESKIKHEPILQCLLNPINIKSETINITPQDGINMIMIANYLDCDEFIHIIIQAFASYIYKQNDDLALNNLLDLLDIFYSLAVEIPQLYVLIRLYHMILILNFPKIEYDKRFLIINSAMNDFILYNSIPKNNLFHWNSENFSNILDLLFIEQFDNSLIIENQLVEENQLVQQLSNTSIITDQLSNTIQDQNQDQDQDQNAIINISRPRRRYRAKFYIISN